MSASLSSPSGISSPLGVHRVLEPAGRSLPQAARVLDARPDLWPDEVRIDVETLNLDAASYRQLHDKHAGDGAAIRAEVLAIVGERGNAGQMVYAASKAALVAAAKSAAKELGRHGIRVNAVAPGYIRGTRLTSARDEATGFGMPEEIIPQVEDSIPIGRAGEPDDVAALVAFLASPDSDYITGQLVEIHGGLEIVRVA